MNVTVTPFQKWVLKRIFKQIIVQGYHNENVTTVMQLLRDECDRTFTEDNSPTLDCFMIERLADTLQSDHFRLKIKELTQ